MKDWHKKFVVNMKKTLVELTGNVVCPTIIGTEQTIKIGDVVPDTKLIESAGS